MSLCLVEKHIMMIKYFLKSGYKSQSTNTGVLPIIHRHFLYQSPFSLCHGNNGSQAWVHLFSHFTFGVQILRNVDDVEDDS